MTENWFGGGHLNASEVHKIIVPFYFEVLFAPTMIIFSNFCLHHKYSTLHAKINLMTHRYPCDTDVPTLCNLPSYVLACNYLTVGPLGYWYLWICNCDLHEFGRDAWLVPLSLRRHKIHRLRHLRGIVLYIGIMILSVVLCLADLSVLSYILILCGCYVLYAFEVTQWRYLCKNLLNCICRRF